MKQNHFLLITIVIFCFCIFCACSSVEFTISFIVDDDIYAAIKTNGNEAIKMPTNPTKLGFTFDGWYWDNDTWKKPFTANSLLDAPLSSNMSVYAKWINESSVSNVDISVNGAIETDFDSLGKVFFISSPNNIIKFSFSDIVEISSHATWSLTTDVYGKNDIPSKTVELSVGNNIFYANVAAETGKTANYIIVVRRRPIYIVSFDTKGGTYIEPQIVEENNIIYQPNQPTKEGYSFTNWNFDFNTKITQDTIIDCSWTANTYIVTFDSNGGDCDLISTPIVYLDTLRLPQATKLGYSFVGWYNNNEYISNLSTYNYTKDITLTAHWQLQRYNLVYSTKDTNNPSQYDVTTATFTLKNPSQIGYDFIGWTYDDISVPQLIVTISTGTVGDKYFTAHWQAKTYVATFNVNGGDLDTATANYTYDGKANLPVPTKKHYIFEGWQYNNRIYTNINQWKFATNVTFTAKWTPQEYRITYELNGGNWNTSYPTHYTIETETFTIPNPYRDGYTFLGWTTKNITTPTLGPTVKQGSAEEKHLVAQWSANTYKIYLNANGGSCSKEFIEVTYNKQFTLPMASRVGYSFLGWYNNSKAFNDGVWQQTNNVTLDAQWEANKNTKYRVNHWQQNIINDEYTLAETNNYFGISDSSVQPLVNMYEGFTSPNSQTVIISADGSQVVNYFYTRNYYSISFVTNGGNTIDPYIKKYQSELQLPSAQRTGYTFGGWFTSEKLNESFLQTTMPTINTTVYAWWIEENKPCDFNYTKGTEVLVKSYIGTSAIMWIPSYIGGELVTNLAENAFSGVQITNVVVPFGVTVIPSYSFSNCNSLIEVRILGNITNIDNYAFSGCSLIENFNSNSQYSLKTPETVNTIGDYAFQGLGLILEVEIGDNVEHIGQGAFKGCNSIQTIALPFIGESSDSIGKAQVFGHIFGSSYNTGIDNKAKATKKDFMNKQYGNNIDGAIWQFSQYSHHDNDGYAHTDFYYKSYSYYIPQTIKSVIVKNQNHVPTAAFNNCSFIENIKFSQELIEIGECAFQNCNSFTSFNSSNQSTIELTTVSAIGDYAFKGLKLVTNVVLGNNMERIGQGAFEGCNSIENITLPFIGESLNSQNFNAVFGYIFGYTKIDSYKNNLKGSSKYSEDFVNTNFSSSSGDTWQYSCYNGTNYSKYPGRYWSLVAYYYHIPLTIRRVTILTQTDVPNAAFNNCSFIETIHLVNCITSVGDYSFQDCNATLTYDISPTISVPWNGTSVASKYHDGEGTEENPYQIFSPAEFVYFIKQINAGVDYSGVHFLLTSNLKMNKHQLSAVATTKETTFNGILNGNGHSISDFEIISTNTTYNGFFGYISGTIKNVVFENITLSAITSQLTDVYNGLLVGQLVGNVENVSITGEFTVSTNRTGYTGGLVGHNIGTITNCNTNIIITATSTNFKCYAGGVIGYNEGTLTTSTSTSTIKARGYADSYTYVDELVGYSK